MKQKTIKLKFETNRDEYMLEWDEYENVILADLNDNNKHSYRIHIKHPMSDMELTKAVRELCQKIEYNHSYRAAFHIDAQCTGERAYLSEYISGFVSATVYIEALKTED